MSSMTTDKTINLAVSWQLEVTWLLSGSGWGSRGSVNMKCCSSYETTLSTGEVCPPCCLNYLHSTVCCQSAHKQHINTLHKGQHCTAGVAMAMAVARFGVLWPLTAMAITLCTKYCLQKAWNKTIFMWGLDIIYLVNCFNFERVCCANNDDKPHFRSNS